jgi:hypothetical protein
MFQEFGDFLSGEMAMDACSGRFEGLIDVCALDRLAL